MKTEIQENIYCNLNNISLEDDPLCILPAESWVKIDSHIQKVQRALRKERNLKATADAPTKEGLRNILRGIYYRRDKNCKWKEIPAVFGDHKIIYAYFRNWLNSGLTDKVDRLVRKQEKKNAENWLEQWKVSQTAPPEPTDVQKAFEAILDLNYQLKHWRSIAEVSTIADLPFNFDLLTDDEQLRLLTFLGSEINIFADMLKIIEDHTCSSELAAQALANEAHRFDMFRGWPGTLNLTVAKETFYIVESIATCVNDCLIKVMAALNDFTSLERSKAYAGLAKEIEVLNALRNEMAEVEQMNKNTHSLWR